MSNIDTYKRTSKHRLCAGLPKIYLLNVAKTETRIDTTSAI